MSLKTILVDAFTKRTARVTPTGAVIATLSQSIPVEEETLNVPFSRFMTIDGVLTEDDPTAKDLNIDGSVNQFDAFIGSSVDGDIYLTTMEVLIADGTVSLRDFGGINGGLANGVQFFYETGRGRITVPQPFKTNFDFIRTASLTPPLGSKNDAFQISNVVAGTNDAYLPTIDLTRLSPLGFGIRIRKDSLDRLGVRIRDNLTALSAFDILVSGFLRLEDG